MICYVLEIPSELRNLHQNFIVNDVREFESIATISIQQCKSLCPQLRQGVLDSLQTSENRVSKAFRPDGHFEQFVLTFKKIVPVMGQVLPALELARAPLPCTTFSTSPTLSSSPVSKSQPTSFHISSFSQSLTVLTLTRAGLM